MLSIQRNPERMAFCEAEIVFSPDFSIYVGEKHVSDIYDLTEKSQDDEEKTILDAYQNANFDCEPPHYLFFYTESGWKGLYVGFKEIKQEQASLTSFKLDCTADYINDPVGNLWSIETKEMMELIINCDALYVKKKILGDFQRKVQKWLDKHPDALFCERIQKTIENCKNNLNESFYLYQSKFMLSKGFEDNLFLSILGPCNEKKLYRYTSFQTLSYIMNEGTHAMSSIACMNDRSECFYADDIIHYSPQKDPQKTNENEDISILLNYDNFITSFSSFSPQKLKMWRLYGNDGKGVALEYDIEKLKLPADFYLAPVSYPSEEGKHIELEFIKYLIIEKFFGHCLLFKRWNIWQRFFKPLDYKEEQEIRLLYSSQDDKDRKWGTLNGIYSPLAVMSICKQKCDTPKMYPLSISKVFLGPLFPGSSINKLMIEERFRELGLKIDVELADIKHYRG